MDDINELTGSALQLRRRRNMKVRISTKLIYDNIILPPLEKIPYSFKTKFKYLTKRTIIFTTFFMFMLFCFFPIFL